MENPMHIRQGGLPLFNVAPGVWCLRTLFVNVFFVGGAAGNTADWVLIDAGYWGHTQLILKAAHWLFGPGAKPAAILLTHGHSDHTGNLEALVKHWQVPVVAHHKEMPYLTGKAWYPMPDATAGSTYMAWLSPLFRRKPLELNTWMQELPANHSVPHLPSWTYIESPGHTPGHVAFWREADGVLLTGDAFVTTRQMNGPAMSQMDVHISGPPKFFTIDWEQAEQSVQRLAALHPAIVGSGHGLPMRGPELQTQLMHLVLHFKELAVPKHGRFTGHPAQVNEDGVVVQAPPVGTSLWPTVALGVGVAAIFGTAVWLALRSAHQHAATPMQADDDRAFENYDLAGIE